MARKNKINQSSQALHPFLDLEYQTSTHLNDVNEIDVSQASLPTPKPSKFPPYSPKIVSGSELGGVMYGPKLGSFPPSLSSNTTLTLPTVPIPPTFSELQVRRKIKNLYMDSKIQISVCILNNQTLTVKLIFLVKAIWQYTKLFLYSPISESI